MNGFTFADVALAIGGVALFLLGVRYASDGLKGLAGRNLRIVLSIVTRRRLPAMAVGTAISFLLQGATAATIMLVGLVNAGLLNLLQAAGVALGTCVGTTLIIQLIAFDVGRYALLGVAAGLVLPAAGRNRVVRGLANVLLGFGLIFYGIPLIRAGLGPIAASPAMQEIFLKMGTHWAWFLAGVLAAAAVTVITQSSVATIAVAFGLARAGAITPLGALAFVYGAHVSTFVMPLLAGIGSPRRGKQVVLFVFLLRLAGVLIFMPLSVYIVQMAEVLAAPAGDAARVIAWEHTLLNAGNALIVLPFLGMAVGGVARLLPERAVLPAGVVEFVDPKFTDPPPIALEKARKEIHRMGMRVSDDMKRAIRALEDNDAATLQAVAAADDATDLAYEIVSDYLSRVKQPEATPAELAQHTKLLYAVKTVELVGDVVSKDVVELGLKKERMGRDFSIGGSRLLREFHQHVQANFIASLELILDPRPDRARRVMEADRDLDEERHGIYRTHLEQIQRGVREAQETSSIYADVLAALQQIARYSAEIAETMAFGARR